MSLYQELAALHPYPRKWVVSIFFRFVRLAKLLPIVIPVTHSLDPFVIQI
jgi:hypothetical protein